MRLWHAAAITILLAVLYAPVFVPSLTPLPLLGHAALICIVFALVDGAILAIGRALDRTPSWLAISGINVGLWVLAWIV